mgnify:CR=1 FL=1|jgi:A/G-specific adenine glycosylase
MTDATNQRSVIKRQLIKWYDRGNRDMPWRKTSDPYRILLSEFMLQQTQVETVIPYYKRFTDAFPTIQDLASAELDDVLKLWEGLGYYSRARNLHKAAQAISDSGRGEVPNTYDDLIALPGFGPYTTAAVLSIAYGKRYAVLDGNVIRVLTRLYGLTDQVDLTATKKKLQTLADDLLNNRRPGDHNQAIMELGATVCKPRTPDCGHCPIRQHCRALEQGTVLELPNKLKPKPRPEHAYVAAIICRDDHYLISQRKASGLLGGLWEFASIRMEDNDTFDVSGAIRESFGVSTQGHRHFKNVRHAYTHFSANVDAFTCDWIAGEPRSEEHDGHAWVSKTTIETYAYSRIARRLVDALVSSGHQTQMALNLE